MKLKHMAAALFGGLILTLGISLPAQAHTPQASITCAGYSVSLKSYDARATADVTVDGQLIQHGTFGGNYVKTGTLVSDAAHPSHRLVVTVVSTDGTQYNFTFDKTVTGCYTAPPTQTPTPTPTVTPPVVTPTPTPTPTVTPPVVTPSPTPTPTVTPPVTTPVPTSTPSTPVGNPNPPSGSPNRLAPTGGRDHPDPTPMIFLVWLLVTLGIGLWAVQFVTRPRKTKP